MVCNGTFEIDFGKKGRKRRNKEGLGGILNNPRKSHSRKMSSSGSDGGLSVADARSIRESIDSEAQMQNQILSLTEKLEGVLNKKSASDITTSKIAKQNSKIAKNQQLKRIPASRARVVKKTNRNVVPEEMFEKIQQGDLRVEMESNEDLDIFLADQGLEEYADILMDKGFESVLDLSKLKEKDIDFEIKKSHKTRLLWLAKTEKIILKESEPPPEPKIVTTKSSSTKTTTIKKK